jgi:hypothetical protein
MHYYYPICRSENREIDGFDLIAILGLMKEFNRKEIWRRYFDEDAKGEGISAYVASKRYFIELHIQQMERIILSEKFNTNPFFMQQLVQRMTASHRHELIVEKIKGQGIDTGENLICLSCSMGNTIVDLIVNKNEPFPEVVRGEYGSTHVEMVEKRPLDTYDFSSILYLCQQNLTDSIFRRYGKPNEKSVKVNAVVGAYEVALSFYLVRTDEEQVIPPPGNASASTMHQVLQRMNFGHGDVLILKELQDVGLSLDVSAINEAFTLRRLINNTMLQIDFRKI